MNLTFYLMPTSPFLRLLLSVLGLFSFSPLFAQTYNYNAGEGSGTGGAGFTMSLWSHLRVPPIPRALETAFWALVRVPRIPRLITTSLWAPIQAPPIRRAIATAFWVRERA